MPLKTGSAFIIPEEIQKPMRERLRTARVIRGHNQRALTDVVSPGALTRWESKDISSMKLGTMYKLGERLGWTPAEFMQFLTGPAGEVVEVDEDDRLIRQMIIYLRSMSLPLKRMACEIVSRIVDYNAKEGGPTTRALKLLNLNGEKSTKGDDIDELSSAPPRRRAGQSHTERAGSDVATVSHAPRASRR